MDNNIENNENKSICKSCGGKCCKRYSGGYHPDDFGVPITEEFLESLFNPVTDDIPLISIDWYECFNEDYDTTHERGYYLRPRHFGGDIVDPSYGEACINLTPTGCKLDWDKRPFWCKKLKPTEGFGCGTGKDKLEAAIEWDPYHDILDKLCKKYDKGTHTGKRPLSIWDYFSEEE